MSPRNSIIATNVSGMQPVYEENAIGCRQINVNLKPGNKTRNKDSLDTDAALAECIFGRNERHAMPLVSSECCVAAIIFGIIRLTREVTLNLQFRVIMWLFNN